MRQKDYEVTLLAKEHSAVGRIVAELFLADLPERECTRAHYRKHRLTQRQRCCSTEYRIIKSFTHEVSTGPLGV